MVNAPFSFICGLVWLAVALDLQTRGESVLVVVGVFFFAFFWLVPLTIFQLWEDERLMRVLGKVRPPKGS